MPFHCDSMYIIGDSHKVCEDYAAHNERGIALSDGCSSSKDTDIGARLIVRECLYSTYSKLKDSYGVAPFSKEMFDATQLYAKFNEGANWFECRVWGDGVLAFIDKYNRIWIYEYIYPNGYPYYYSYAIDKTKFFLWSKSKPKRICRVFKDKEFFNTYPSDHFTFFPKDIKSIAIFSDGIESFTDEKNKKVPVVDIVTELMAFKNTNGEFVTRRMTRFLKDCKKRGWKHHDDVSMATIMVDEDESIS